MNFLTENKIEYYSDLESKIADIMTAHDAAARAVKDVEQRMSCLLYTSLCSKNGVRPHSVEVSFFGAVCFRFLRLAYPLDLNGSKGPVSYTHIVTLTKDSLTVQ